MQVPWIVGEGEGECTTEGSIKDLGGCDVMDGTTDAFIDMNLTENRRKKLINLITKTTSQKNIVSTKCSKPKKWNQKKQYI